MIQLDASLQYCFGEEDQKVDLEQVEDDIKITIIKEELTN